MACGNNFHIDFVRDIKSLISKYLAIVYKNESESFCNARHQTDHGDPVLCLVIMQANRYVKLFISIQTCKRL